MNETVVTLDRGVLGRVPVRVLWHANEGGVVVLEVDVAPTKGLEGLLTPDEQRYVYETLAREARQ